MHNPPATAGIDVCRMYGMIDVRGITNETLIIGDFVLWMVH
ncbi:hypothetical protein VCHA51O444_10611 [Vibrio chagasii]|nr:hypothetical protein VCHA51O444_10611 [Vibrio chagasii]CAH7359286.1 hypothetical protein VCHA53O474_30417 [Vibrio chagasii]